MGKLAVILLRGKVCTVPKVRKTMELLKLNRKHSCVILADTPQNKGMARAVQGFAAWGEIDEKTLSDLVKKKGEVRVYHLKPPRKGFGTKGIRKPFKVGGALGYQGSAINNLLGRML